MSWISIRRDSRNASTLTPEAEFPEISVIVPAFNEGRTIVESVSSFLSSDYPQARVIVVNDGSADDTEAALINHFNLTAEPLKRLTMLGAGTPVTTYRSRTYPALTLISQPNRGKASALNLGVDFTGSPLICTVDSDTILDPDALSRAARTFSQCRETLLGVGGTLRVANGSVRMRTSGLEGRLPHSALSVLQIIEYIRAFFIGRIGWDVFDATMLLSGAFAVFRREALLEVGGFDATSITEDLEITVRLRRYFGNHPDGPRFRILRQPVAWTQVPETLAELRTQRVRWQRWIGAIKRHFLAAA